MMTVSSEIELIVHFGLQESYRTTHTHTHTLMLNTTQLSFFRKYNLFVHHIKYRIIISMDMTLWVDFVSVQHVG